MDIWNEIVNDLCREFRAVRDRLMEMGEIDAKKFVKRRLDEFWNEQPCYLLMFRKPIMRFLYGILKKLSS